MVILGSNKINFCYYFIRNYNFYIRLLHVNKKDNLSNKFEVFKKNVTFNLTAMNSFQQ